MLPSITESTNHVDTSTLQPYGPSLPEPVQLEQPEEPVAQVTARHWPAERWWPPPPRWPSW